MQCRIHTHLILLFLISTSLFSTSAVIGQVRSKLSNLQIEVGTGYDTNLFRVAGQSDSNRVEAPAETINGKIAAWVYWSRRIKSYVSSSGKYSYYPNKSFANEWEWKAKSKTSFTVIKRRRARFLSAIKLNISFAGVQKNTIFTNRALGAENFRDVNDNGLGQVQLGDLFDRISYRYGGGVEFKFDKNSSLTLAYSHANNNFTDIGAPATENFFSLDNAVKKIEANFDIGPSKIFKMKFSYEGQAREYDYKAAKDISGREISNLQRQYWIDKYGLSAYWNVKRLQAKIAMISKKRNDRFEGYYNYVQAQIKGEMELTVSPNWILSMGWQNTWKDYIHLEIGGNRLSNRYFTLETGLTLPLQKNLQLHTSFVHDREKSTFATFTYNRNIVMAGFEYKME